jgi:hypothetical protein
MFGDLIGDTNYTRTVHLLPVVELGLHDLSADVAHSARAIALSFLLTSGVKPLLVRDDDRVEVGAQVHHLFEVAVLAAVVPGDEVGDAVEFFAPAMFYSGARGLSWALIAPRASVLALPLATVPRDRAAHHGT